MRRERGASTSEQRESWGGCSRTGDLPRGDEGGRWLFQGHPVWQGQPGFIPRSPGPHVKAAANHWPPEAWEGAGIADPLPAGCAHQGPLHRALSGPPRDHCERLRPPTSKDPTGPQSLRPSRPVAAVGPASGTGCSDHVLPPGHPAPLGQPGLSTSPEWPGALREEQGLLCCQDLSCPPPSWTSPWSHARAGGGAWTAALQSRPAQAGGPSAPCPPAPGLTSEPRGPAVPGGPSCPNPQPGRCPGLISASP